MDLISKPMGWVLKYLCLLCGGNFAGAIVLFTILINLLMLPLTIKTQKSQAKQARLRPKLDAIKKKCGDDKQKYSQEMSELYSREGVSMSGGCLPMIIRMIFIYGVYAVVINPLVYIMGANASEVSALMSEQGLTRAVGLIQLIHNGTVPDITNGAIDEISFSFFGLNLADQPVFSWNIIGGFQAIWLVPLLSFVTSMFSSISSMIMQKKTNPDAPSMMGMMLIMPLFSLWIAFSVPGAVGFYWACSNLIASGIQVLVQIIYNPSRIIAGEQAKDIIKMAKAEQLKKQLE